MVMKTTSRFFSIFHSALKGNSQAPRKNCKELKTTNQKEMKTYSNKKAQMKIQQMSFMLLGVFLFFVLVGMMILTVKLTGIRESATELREQNAILLVTKLASSPEFSCGNVYGNEKTDCIDLDKVMILKDNIAKYTDFWGVTNIEIRRLYPKNQKKECTPAIYPECDTIKLISSSSKGAGESNFVALCRKEVYNGNIIDKCEIGEIIVRWETIK